MTAFALSALVATAAAAQTVKIGVVDTFSGPQASFGDFTDKAFRLYLKLHEKELPAGVKIELINRDDGGPNPDRAKQLAQELVTRNHVNLLAGAAFTPVGLAIAPVATAAKTPFVITNAGTAVITTKSPYIVRFSFTIEQSVVPLGAWAAKHFKTAYTLVSDYAPGHGAEEAFIQSFKAGGGTVVGSVRVPVREADFAPYMQRVKDAKPAALMVFVPAGRSATAVMKSFADLGMGKAGIKLIGPGDVTDDDLLNGMGDAVLGAVTAHLYSADHNSAKNKAFVEAFKKANSYRPNFMAVGGYDGMHLIYEALKKTGGKSDGDSLIAAMKGMKWESPRGPISIDPDTRDIVQNEYLREVRKVDGRLANVELETIATAVKDPWKEQRKGK
jgi:branched-chain amino acid transport system substrate-binding protein